MGVEPTRVPFVARKEPGRANDNQRLPLIPVGGRLAEFYPRWKNLTEDEWVINVIKVGYHPTFAKRPPLSPSAVGFNAPQEPEKVDLLTEAVQAMVAKNAIVVVDKEHLDPGFYSRLFLVPKPTGGWRPVIDLSRLNKFLVVPHFKMETTRSVTGAIQPGDWSISVDLADAYFHVPLRSSFSRFTRFYWQGSVYQFRVLCFGLSTAPRVFTRIVSALAAACHRSGLKLHTYLDDWLLRAQDRQMLIRQRDFLLQLTAELGFLVNEEKSSMIPSQDFTYIGVRFRTDLGISLPPPKRVEAIISQTTTLRNQPSVKAITILRWLGLVNSAADHIPWGRLHMRPMQIFLLSVWRPHRDSLDQMLYLPHDLLKEAWSFWTDESLLCQGMPLSSPSPQIVVQTDASLSGWGAQVDSGHLVSGEWSPLEAEHHINWLELRAVEKALGEVSAIVQGKVVLIKSDNSTTVQYINRQGGTRSGTLCSLTFRLLRWCRCKGIVLRAEHIPGRLNLIPDALSRSGTLAPTEWSLPRHFVSSLCDLWWDPKVDLFANHLNHRLPLYVAPAWDPRAMAVDALSMSWDNMVAYAFPPFALVPLVLDKVGRSSVCRIILVAPLWPKRSWFPRILELLVGIPRRLGPDPGLLYHHISKVYHSNPDIFNLHAWPLSSVRSLRRDFLRDLPDGSLSVTSLQQQQFTNQSGSCSLIGQTEGKWIHSLPLFS